MLEPIVPARLNFLDDGTPFSAAFDDVYHSTHGYVEQARHVFLGGTGLPARWAAREVFTIVETGFGLGINFLVTWAAWLADPAGCDRLHFVSIEKHPLTSDDLALAHARLFEAAAHKASFDAAQDAIELPRLAAQLQKAWPILSSGTHRLEFAGPGTRRIVLTLVFGDIQALLPKLWLRADAFYLDGFAPSKNPAMWSADVCKSLARIAATEAYAATYTVAGSVRRALQEHGFVVEKMPGYGPKRDMLRARFAPRWRVRRHEPPLPSPQTARDALIIGAGLAGCALAERLSARGWDVTLFEQAPTAAAAASGNPLGLFHPLFARDDNLAARLARAGFLYLLTHCKALVEAGHPVRWQPDGLLQLAADAEESATIARTLERLGHPSELVKFIDRDQASKLAGVDLAQGGCFFAQGGWLDPISLCTAQLATAGSHLRTHFNIRIDTLRYRAGRWHALDTQGESLASASVAIVANSHDAARLAGMEHAPLERVRGQLTILPKGTGVEPNLPLTGDGYLSPGPDGTVVAGASYDIGDTDPALRRDSQLDTFAKAARLLPAFTESLISLGAHAPLTGRVAFRCVTRDHLPMIGQLADENLAHQQATLLAGAHPLDLPRRQGLYGAFAFGSRGLIWAALGAELLASLIHGEPLPVEKDLADAIDPARFLLRELRQQHNSPVSSLPSRN